MTECADGEADQSFNVVAQQAVEGGSALLLCGLVGRIVRRTAEADPPRDLEARLGGLLISPQALNFVLGARNQCVLDRVVELNPCSMESKGYRVFKVRQ